MELKAFRHRKGAGGELLLAPAWLRLMVSSGVKVSTVRGIIIGTHEWEATVLQIGDRIIITRMRQRQWQRRCRSSRNLILTVNYSLWRVFANTYFQKCGNQLHGAHDAKCLASFCSWLLYPCGARQSILSRTQPVITSMAVRATLAHRNVQEVKSTPAGSYTKEEISNFYLIEIPPRIDGGDLLLAMVR